MPYKKSWINNEYTSECVCIVMNYKNTRIV
jgi:hypothetical protein